MKILSILVAIFIGLSGYSQNKTLESRFDSILSGDICISTQEKELLHLIKDYRSRKKLPKIKLSKSLTIVAKMHVLDLSENEKLSTRCDLHSWSGKGKLKGCCYTGSMSDAPCMWDKPRQLTSYKGNGYEIAFEVTGDFDPAEVPEMALEAWEESTGHRAVILNKGPWKKVKWRAIGVGIYKGYAVVWFGEEPDKEEKPASCID